MIESGPAESDYTPGYYAVFFADPDAIKLELLHRLLGRCRRVIARACAHHRGSTPHDLG